MNFMTKLIIQAITIGATCLGSVYGGIKLLQLEIKDSSNEVKTEIYEKIHDFRDERNALIQAQDEKFSVQMLAVNQNMVELKKDVRAILILSRKAQARLENSDKSYYTINESLNSKGNHL